LSAKNYFRTQKWTLRIFMSSTPRSTASGSRDHSEKLVGDILKALNECCLNKIRKQFDRYDSGVNLETFISIMQSHIPNLRTRDLYELFQQIDVNGDGSMEWNEVMAFMVEKSSTYKDAVKDSLYVPFKEQDRSTGLDEKEILKLNYIQELDTIAEIRTHSKVIRLYDAQVTSSEIGRLSGYSGVPICCEYIPNNNSMEFANARIQAGTLATACLNLTIVLWSLAPGENQFTVSCKWPTRHTQTSLCWINQYKTLFSCSVAGTIHLWDIENRTEKACIREAHEDIGTCLKPVNEIDCIASGGMDDVVCLWDVHNCVKRQTFRGHGSGILALEYCPAHKTILSGSVDHKICLWSPFSPLCTYELVGHNEPVVDIHRVSGSDYEIVSGDTSGTFKLWDLRTYGCIQTFTDESPHELNNMTSFVACDGHDSQNATKVDNVPYMNRIVAGTKRLHIFDQRDPIIELVSEDIPVISAIINTVFLQVITATSKRVRIWDLLTGKLLREYADIVTSDMTSICLDDRQRKFIIGTHNGDISVFNYSSGALMKRLDPHHAEVSKLLYLPSQKYVLSVSWDKTIVLHDEVFPEIGVKIREMDNLFAHTQDITSVDCLPPFNIVTGSSDECIHIWDFASGKLKGKRNVGGEVTCVKFLRSDLLLAARTDGTILLLDCPLQDRFHVNNTMLQVPHPRDEEGKTKETSAVLSVAFESNMMITGDEFGTLRCWGFDSIDLLQITEYVSNPSSVFNRKWINSGIHEDGITSVDVSSALNIVVTACFDCSVRVFNLEDGTNTGVLIYGAGRGNSRSSFWNVPFDAEVIDWDNFKIPKSESALETKLHDEPFADLSSEQKCREPKRNVLFKSSHKEEKVPVDERKERLTRAKNILLTL